MTPGPARLAISLRAEIDQGLRHAAATNRTKNGVIVRALVAYGLEHIDDPGIQAAIDAEISAQRQRRVEIGRASMEARYGKPQEDGNDRGGKS